ncbi:LuxR family transcriptional regulator [Frankia sp. AgB1.9]|uniref:LuxR C-terminal-related transcriptional regulator n=1 Tax=unclassified Frankia TaxID=2632575 RepID=UPI001933B13F|nr:MULTISPECIES: LuxR C-terminal-related transcriptional regulator [unclassified Frankia]MBL7492577.1 LuxR family transcriptional regulator [Frankia sp. AgW1.1]MBL7548730.1 LuxR family transcriptional regulator [Frankia sp. AgB1.9]MBL7619328.1 LuxR family transcriptional regulator [Frankia sp. AgB1.8]
MPEPCQDNVADEFLAGAAFELRERTGVDLTLAGRVHPRTRILTIRCADGARTDACLGLTLAPGRGAGGRVVTLGRPVSDDYANKPVVDSSGRRRVECREDLGSLLAMPLRLGGRVAYVMYLGERAGKPFGTATTRSALTFMQQLETYIARAARSYQFGSPQRWNVDERALAQIFTELAQLSREVAAAPARERIAAIRKLLAESMLEAMPDQDGRALTRRELDVLRLVAEGLSNAEAAQQLVVSPETVKAYLRNIRSKLGVNNRTAAVTVARRAGMLQ